MTVRSLLRSIGQERRGKNVNLQLRALLQKNGLTTDPNFELVGIASKLTLKPATKRKVVIARKFRPTCPLPEQSLETSKASVVQDSERDVILTIGQLPAAERPPVFITRDEPIERAITLMLQEGIEHLVVSVNERSPDGVISWQSIGKARASQKPDKLVSDCMEREPRIVRFDAPLFDTVREITNRGVVLVKAVNNKICGLVSARDIAEQFVTLSEPFLFLEQIENHLRVMLRFASLSQEGLARLVNPQDIERQSKVKSVNDLTFGETLRAFSDVEVWEKTKLGLDRKTILARLEEVRLIRNRVMHFHPDGISDKDREVLRRTRSMLQDL